MKPPKIRTDEELAQFNQRQQFVRDALPSEWLNYSEELGDAAEALWADSANGLRVEAQTRIGGGLDIQRQTAHSRFYVLLAGLALENVLKAHLVLRDAALVSTGTLSRPLKSHKLADLAAEIPDLAFSEDDSRVLRICQDAIPYWGRYPIPLDYAGLRPTDAATPEFREHFRDLHLRLCREVYLAIRDGWDSGVGPKILATRNRRYGDEIDMNAPLPLP